MEKKLYGYFKQQTNPILYKKNWTWLRKENLKRETQSFLIAAQNNAIRTNYVKAETDNAQQNSRYRLCGDKNETINYIMSENINQSESR